jgi:uncharacterized membrane protein
MSLSPSSPPGEATYSPAELAALAQLYRGELYRSKIWRTRLDTTTNWGVATTGLALSITFSEAGNTAIPILLIILLVTVFWGFEARRYHYFDIWRTRVRMLEVGLYVPILRGEGVNLKSGWHLMLAEDYSHLRFHITFWEAAGRRLRRNYIWIFLVLGLSYYIKLIIHPTPTETLQGFLSRASIGFIPGPWVIGLVTGWYVVIVTFALLSMRKQEAVGRVESSESEHRLLRKRMEL